jgi:disulfide bond formation protein DsbB
MLAPPRDRAAERLKTARLLALALPVALLGGALLSQYVGGLYPCEMCWWQRYPHGVAILLAGAAYVSPPSASRTRTLTLLAALGVALSGLVGALHAGVEYGWWEGITTCSTGGAMSLDDIMAVPLIRCDQVQWTLFGVSLAGYNAIFSLGGALAIALLARRKSA